MKWECGAVRVTVQAASCRSLGPITLFDHRPVHEAFVLDEVTVGQVSLPVLQVPPVSVIPPVLHIHSLTATSTTRSAPLNNTLTQTNFLLTGI
jgi:hypothetical protein